jgi:hypothetical protein
MKLYFFNPNDFGTEYYVMHESKQQALESVKSFLKRMADGDGGDVATVYRDDYENLWENASVDLLPAKYSIDEFSLGQVIEGYNG